MSQEIALKEVSALEPSKFEQIRNMAEFLAQGDLIPAHFQKKPANVFIALQYALRMNLDPFMVMSSMYIVHGRPSWEGKFLIALVNHSGLFDEPLEFIFEGQGDEYGCFARARKGRKTIDGPKVSWKMVKAEGWDKPKGGMKSKWETLAPLMFRYRAGSYFVNTVCPEVKLGLPTREELEDVVDLPLADEPRLIQPDAAAIKEAFWKALEEINIPKDDEDLTLFLDETAQALGRAKVEVMQGALEQISEFFHAYQAWLAEKAQPEAEQTQEAAAFPETDQTQESEPARNEAQDPNEKIKIDTMNAIAEAARKKGKPLAAILNDHGEKGRLLKDLTEAKGQEILAALKE